MLFQIAEDLSKMEIVLAIDEADIGQVKPGQAVAFTVDAFPDRRFRGEVQQVRLSATNTSNVITYPVVVAVDNREQLLLPGMTANAEIEGASRDDVLRVPTAALRYRPDEGELSTPAAPSRRSGMQDELPRIAAGLELDAAQKGRFDAALAAMRERAQARRETAATGGQGGGSVLFGGGRGRGGPGGGGASGSAGMDGALRQRMIERFNQQFGAFRESLDDARRAQWDAELAALVGARRAPLYRLRDGRIEAVTVRVGSSDGSWTEVAGDIADGDTIVTGRERSAQ